jgi:hypothetical protein
MNIDSQNIGYAYKKILEAIAWKYLCIMKILAQE